MAERLRSTPLSDISNRPTVEKSVEHRQNIKLRRRSRCYTPYQKTPRSRSIRGIICQQRTPPPRVNTDHFREIINITWRVYRVSPLFSFHHDATLLKQYSKLLSAHILSEQRKGCAVGVDECADQATFSLFSGLTLSPDGPEAVEITLKKIGQRGKGRDGYNVVLTAILCGLQSVTTASRTQGLTRLPVMLVRGPVGLTKLLVSWLQMTFDCCAGVMHFSPLQLSWMVAMWAGEVLEKKKHSVQLQYSTPAHVEGLSKVTLDIDALDCQKLWRRIHDVESDEFAEEEVKRFINAVEQHFFFYFKIELQAMALCRVGTATVYAGTDGRIKVFSMAHIKQVLSHITNLVTEQTLIR